MQHVGIAPFWMNSQPSNVRFSAVEFEFQAEPGPSVSKQFWFKNLFPSGTYSVDLKTLGEVTVDGKTPYSWQLGVNGKSPLCGNCRRMDEKTVRANLSNASILGFLVWVIPDVGYDNHAAQAFASAMNALRLYARNYEASRSLPPPCFTNKDEQARIWAEFQRRAAAWRALPVRPPLSEAVRKQQLLAEDAYNQKQFEVAAAAYDSGTEFDPMWPEGHFNAAFLYGELKEYEDAIWHMRCYLELLPNAPDSKNARDQMLLWQAKLEQQASSHVN
jgi:tetratricopeptide (TPR) repeat protein